METQYNEVLDVVAALDRWYLKWLADDATDEHKVEIHTLLQESVPDSASDSEKEAIVEERLIEHYQVNKLTELPRPRLYEAGKEIPLDEIELSMEELAKFFPTGEEE